MDLFSKILHHFFISVIATMMCATAPLLPVRIVGWALAARGCLQLLVYVVDCVHGLPTSEPLSAKHPS